MYILGIETSCDETAASIIEASTKEKKINILSDVISSSLPLHSKTGGIIPEVAARQQLKYIIPVIKESLERAKINNSQIDVLSVTVGPGLVGSLLVGIETAKTLSFAWKKPLIPVNHLIGHVYANFTGGIKPDFPSIALIISGGHTDLLLMENFGQITLLGGTRDDAAGEAFDKIGRLLGLSYPAGPLIEEKAKKGDPKSFNFPRPMINSKNFDFSFSGLKTAVWREVQKINKPNEKIIDNICASVQKAISDILLAKTLNAAKKYKIKSILLSGGVSANLTIQENFKLNIKRHLPAVKFFVPEKALCTDNAAMIATSAFYNYQPIPWENIKADPELYF